VWAGKVEQAEAVDVALVFRRERYLQNMAQISYMMESSGGLNHSMNGRLDISTSKEAERDTIIDRQARIQRFRPLLLPSRMILDLHRPTCWRNKQSDRPQMTVQFIRSEELLLILGCVNLEYFMYRR